MARLSKTIRLEFNETLARVMLYFLTSLLVVSIGLSVSFGWLAYTSLSEVATYRESAIQAQDINRKCYIALERADAKLDTVNSLFTHARDGTVLNLGGE